MTIFDIFDVKIVFYVQKYVYWSNLSHIEYSLVNIFKKIRKGTQINKNATSDSIIGCIHTFGMKNSSVFGPVSVKIPKPNRYRNTEFLRCDGNLC